MSDRLSIRLPVRPSDLPRPDILYQMSYIIYEMYITLLKSKSK